MHQSHAPASPIAQLDQPQGLLLPEEAAEHLREIELANKVTAALIKVYPGHLWAASAHGGVCVVRNLALEGRWGFVLHSHRLVNESIEAAATKAGGELLERFNISRNKVGASQARDFLGTRMRGHVLKLPDYAR